MQGLLQYKDKIISEINKIQQEYFTSILLDKVEWACYNNKAVARERESRGQMNERKWKSGSGDRQRPEEFVQEKFTWQKRESVIEWIGWLFWTGCWGWKVKSRLNISSQIVYLTKTTECDKIEKLVTARRKKRKRSELRFTKCLLDKNFWMWYNIKVAARNLLRKYLENWTMHYKRKSPWNSKRLEL